MDAFLVGHRVKLNWPYLIILLWVAVIAYSSLTQEPSEVGVTLVVCPLQFTVDILPPKGI